MDKPIDFESLGIEFIKTPEQAAHAGIFELPPDFPRKELAAEWVPEDAVKFKEQRQPMPGTGAVAPGLTVWKGEDGRGKVIKVHAAGNKVFVLMVRPKATQNAMNALYGNVSKNRYNTEIRGQTIAGEGLQDPGMLPEPRLRENGAGRENTEESLFPLNKVESGAQPEKAAQVST